MKKIFYIITLLLGISGCNNGDHATNMNLAKNTIKLSSVFVKKNINTPKNTNSLKNNILSFSQMTIYFPEDLTLSSIDVKFFSDNACQNQISDYNIGGGSFLYPKGSYVTNDNVMFELCQQFNGGCEGEFGGAQSIQFYYNTQDKVALPGKCSTTTNNIQDSPTANILETSEHTYCSNAKDCGWTSSYTDIVTETPAYIYMPTSSTSSVIQCIINPQNNSLNGCIKYADPYIDGGYGINLSGDSAYITRFGGSIAKCSIGRAQDNYKIMNCGDFIMNNNINPQGLINGPNSLSISNNNFYITNSFGGENDAGGVINCTNFNGSPPYLCSQDYNSYQNSFYQAYALKINNNYAYIVNNTNSDIKIPLQIVKCAVNANNGALSDCNTTGMAFGSGQVFMYDIAIESAPDSNTYAYITTEEPQGEKPSYFKIYRCMVGENGELSDKCDVDYQSQSIGVYKIAFNNDVAYITSFNNESNLYNILKCDQRQDGKLSCANIDGFICDSDIFGIDTKNFKKE